MFSNFAQPYWYYLKSQEYLHPSSWLPRGLHHYRSKEGLTFTEMTGGFWPAGNSLLIECVCARTLLGSKVTRIRASQQDVKGWFLILQVVSVQNLGLPFPTLSEHLIHDMVVVLCCLWVSGQRWVVSNLKARFGSDSQEELNKSFLNEPA